jgi:CcmD family protein
MIYLFSAYSAIWCLLFLYLFSLRSRQRKLERTVEALLKRLEGVREGQS